MKEQIEKIYDYLRQRKINTSVPTVVKFKTKTGDLKRFNARKCGVYVVKWTDVLKALRLK